MGGIFGKVKDNKIVSLRNESSNKEENFERELINYYNEGFINVKLDLNKMEIFINDYLDKILFYKNKDLIKEKMKKEQKNYIIYFLIISNMGLILLEDNKIEKELNILIPKIYLTEKRKEFLNLVIVEDTNREIKIVKNILNKILDSLNEEINEENREIKMANLIGILLRLSISLNIINEMNKGTERDEIIIIISNMISDLISDFPKDECIFINDIDFIKFNPDICSKPKVNKLGKINIEESNLERLKELVVNPIFIIGIMVLILLIIIRRKEEK